MPIEKVGRLIVSPITAVKNLTSNKCRIKMKYFELELPEIAQIAKPGQFVMMWQYGNDEKPMGIAGVNNSIVSFAVAKIGEATTKIHQLKKGDLLGIRGPFGKGFSIQGKKIAIMGGGTGIAPIKFLVETTLKQQIRTTLFHGARTEEELAFYDYFSELAIKDHNFDYQPSSDDGTCGFHGYTTYCFEEKLRMKQKYDALYACGPEIMMHNAWKIAIKEKIPFQASLADRYFKCAIGLCGQCVLDPLGLRLCIEGPVLNGEQLALIDDFGKYARDKFGRKTPFEKE